MRTRHLLTSSVLAITALVFAGCDQTGFDNTGANNDNAPPVKEDLVTVLNPAIAGKLAERLPLSPRLDTLEGKTIYLVDINWGGIEAAYSVFEELKDLFSRTIPGANIILTRTQGNMFTDDPALWKEISEKGDAAIVGIAS